MDRLIIIQSEVTRWRDNILWHIETNGQYMTESQLAYERARLSAYEDVLFLM